MKARPKPRRKAARPRAQASTAEGHRASESIESLVAQAPIILFGLDPSGRFTFSTGRGLAALGLAPGQLVGRLADEVFADQPKALSDARRALKGEDFSSIAQMGRFWFETFYHPLLTATGKLKGVIGLSLDVSARQRVETELIASERRFRAVIDTMHEGFYLTDRQGKRLFVNKALALMYGAAKPADLVGLNFLDRIAPEMREGVRTRFEEAMRTGVFPRRVEVPVLRSDGSRGLLELDPSPIYEDGKLVGACGVVRDVTESRQAEQALRMTQAAVDRCSISIFWSTNEGRIVYVNDAACRTLGYSREEFLAMRICDLDPGLSAARWQEHWADCKREGTRRVERLHRAKDGRLFPVEITISHVQFGGQEYHFAFVQDISERRASEDKLRESQQMLRLVLDHIPQRVFWKDRQSVYAGCNRPFAKDCGFADPGELAGKDDYATASSANADRYRADDAKVMESGQAKLNYEEPQVRQDGSQRVLRTNKVPLRDKDGRVIGILGTYEDITERKDAERALRLTHFAIEHSSEAIFWVGPDGRIRYANPTACRQLGYEAPEILRLSVKDINPEFSGPRWRARWEEARQKGHLQLEARHRTKDGRLLPVDLSVDYVRFEGDELLVTHARDVSERVRLLEFEKAARLEAEAASKARDEFLAIVSHELRTPMTAILGWNWLLRSGDLSAQERERALLVIERNMQMQKQIIEDLLDISSLVRKQLTLRKQIVDLGAVVAEAAAEFKGPAQDACLRLVCEPTLGLTVDADPQRLRQIFWNLISNAVKFTPEGGTVTVRLERKPEQVLVGVEDTGPGISPDFYPHLFDMFRQQEESLTRVHRGLGLGLSIVKHLVELHGGSVAVAPPAPEGGARFTVCLPLAVAPRERAAAAPEAAAEAAPQFPRLLQDIRILVVEDDDDTRSMLVSALRHCGAEVSGAGSASDGLKLFAQARPDVLISDIAMPGEDGYAFIRRVRALSPEEGGLVPAAALTAYATSEDRTKALRAGFQIYLPKPVDPAELVTVVRTLARKPGPKAP